MEEGGQRTVTAPCDVIGRFSASRRKHEFVFTLPGGHVSRDMIQEGYHITGKEIGKNLLKLNTTITTITANTNNDVNVLYIQLYIQRAPKKTYTQY